MRFALDAMGGDHAPEQTVKGAVDFLAEVSDPTVEVILTGDKKALESEISRLRYRGDQLNIVHTTQIVDMHEKPSKIIKSKPDSSLVRAVELVKQGKADGVISAGSTGALLSASLFLLGRIPGVRRPAVCPYFPSEHGGFLLTDAGANVDVRARDMVQFALMARAYSQHLFDHPSPRIGLLNIGIEETKGNEITVRAHSLFKEHVEGFIGNVEGRDLHTGVADVVVCDGFVGNILLKFGEGLVKALGSWAKDKLKRHPVSLFSVPLMKPALKDLMRDLDYEEYGGTPLLGINGIAIVCHGSSSHRSIKNALKTARRCVLENLNEDIEKGIRAHLDLFEEKNGNKQN